MNDGVSTHRHAVTDYRWVDLMSDMNRRKLTQVKIISNPHEVPVPTNDSVGRKDGSRTDLHLAENAR